MYACNNMLHFTHFFSPYVVNVIPTKAGTNLFCSPPMNVYCRRTRSISYETKKKEMKKINHRNMYNKHSKKKKEREKITVFRLRAPEYPKLGNSIEHLLFGLCWTEIICPYDSPTVTQLGFVGVQTYVRFTVACARVCYCMLDCHCLLYMYVPCASQSDLSPKKIANGHVELHHLQRHTITGSHSISAEN